MGKAEIERVAEIIDGLIAGNDAAALRTQIAELCAAHPLP